MKKLFMTAGALVALAVPSAAMADPGNGNAYGTQSPTSAGYVWKDGTGAVNSGNQVAVDSSQVAKNGPAVSAQAQAGDRAATVQSLLP